jgi:23S rRNA (pseudouridine1915-N3)-methyltransferase
VHLQLITVGKRAPKWVQEGVTDYQRRLPPELATTLIEIEPAKQRSGAAAGRRMAEEHERIKKAISPRATVIALDKSGTSYTSEALSRQLAQWLGAGSDCALVVGGAEGLARECVHSADQIWSLSALTFPPALVRVMVLEQLYRAWTILNNHPYHRA